MPFKKATLSQGAWFKTFVGSALLVGIYASYCYSQRIYGLESQRVSDMVTSFCYGGWLGGWLGVLGVLLALWIWNGLITFLEDCTLGYKQMESKVVDQVQAQVQPQTQPQAQPLRNAHS